ncbi:hypothetical protein CMV_023549 [Castanea mollissima]|uniref:Uncharacterized protein n=1 Tax=Castanea mollissima TaxID=60419 RepID=A0A8J4QJD5_9ROSI|nr:hypothetical protein CMV_023549 [Castanea mollissima]
MHDDEPKDDAPQPPPPAPKHYIRVGIWEERKVFGSRAQVLKEELVGRQLENSNRNGKSLNFKLRPPAGNKLEKIVSEYHIVYGGQSDEDVILSKCRNAISSLEKAEKEISRLHTTPVVVAQNDNGKILKARAKEHMFYDPMQAQATAILWDL